MSGELQGKSLWSLRADFMGCQSWGTLLILRCCRAKPSQYWQGSKLASGSGRGGLL